MGFLCREAPQIRIGRDSDQNRSDLVPLDLVTNAKTQFLVTKSNASRTDPELVTLDGVTNPKTQFLVTKSGPFWTARTDAHTSIFGAPLHNKPFGQ